MIVIFIGWQYRQGDLNHNIVIIIKLIKCNINHIFDIDKFIIVK